jgi:hypothetical protein
MNKMAYYNIQKVIRKMNRRKKWNAILKDFRVPFRFNVNKYQEVYGQYLSEYMLRTTKTYGEWGKKEPIEYDKYRGVESGQFHIDMDVYKVKYAELMEKRRQDYPTLGFLVKEAIKNLFRKGD